MAFVGRFDQEDVVRDLVVCLQGLCAADEVPKLRVVEAFEGCSEDYRLRLLPVSFRADSLESMAL